MSTGSPQPNFDTAGTYGDLGWAFWAAAVGTGVAAGLAGGVLMLLLEAVEKLAWGKTTAETLLEAVSASSAVHRVGVVFAAGLCAVLARAVLSRATGGHGGEVTEAIWFHDGVLPFRRTLIQSVFSIVIVGLGASLGREAAPKQMGAAFGGLLGRGAGLSASHRRLLAAFGAGAGIAAVYDVPFGGALLALEVLLGTLSLPLVPPALAASGVATAVSWLMLPMQASYHVAFDVASWPLIAFALVCGPAAGLLAVVFVRLIIEADTLKPKSPMRSVFEPVAVFAGLGCLAIPLPQLLGNGKDLAEQVFTGPLPVLMLVALVILKPVATAACLGSGAPGGLFTPTLTTGAVLGALVGAAFAPFWPDTPAGAYAMIGAAAFLAATTQGPVSAVVLVLELTRRLDTLMVPVILAVAGAVLVSRLLDTRSIYSGRVHAGRRAAELASGSSISAAAPYHDLLQATARQTPDQVPIAIVDKAGRTIGTASADRTRHPTRADGPLETAVAGDFMAGTPDQEPAARG